MSWFRRRRQLPIPKFDVKPMVDPKPAPLPEPMIVEEVIDPSESLVMKFRELIKKRLK